MARIGEIVTQEQLQSLQLESRKNASQTAYVAPTVYRNANRADYINQLYYKNFVDAYKMALIVSGVKNIAMPQPTGVIKFTGSPTAQTMGINVDFYVKVPGIKDPVFAPYLFVKQMYTYYATIGGIGMVVKFYKTNGEGPFYTPIHTSIFSITATMVKNVRPDKIKALDDFHRSCQRMMAVHNSYVTALNQMAARSLTPVEQKYFNQWNLKVQNMRQQMAAIKGVEISYASAGDAIGILPVLIWVIAIAITAIAAAWAVTTLGSQRAAVDKIISNNNFVADQAAYQLEVEKAITAGTITREKGDALIKNSRDQQKAAVENNKTLTDDKPGIFDQLINLAKWAGVIYALKLVGENFGKKV